MLPEGAPRHCPGPPSSTHSRLSSPRLPRMGLQRDGARQPGICPGEAADHVRPLDSRERKGREQGNAGVREAGPSAGPSSSPLGRGGGRPQCRGGCCQPRLPCSSRARQRPLRQCHTAARVTTWPTTTREGNRPPEGSMALAPDSHGQSRRSCLPSPLRRPGSPLPSPGGPGTAPPAGPPCCTHGLAPQTGLVEAPTVLPPPPLPPPSWSLGGAPRLPQAPDPAQQSLRRAVSLKVSGNLNPCSSAATPAGRRRLWLCEAKPQPPPAQLGRPRHKSPPPRPHREGDRGAQAPHSASKGALW